MKTPSMRAVAVIVVLLMSAACFTRHEEVVIKEDGSAQVTYEIKGSREEVETATGVPAAAGWPLIEDSVSATRDGDEVTRTWRRELADVNDYPSRFASRDDADAALAPATETSLEMVREGDRVVYRFNRRYIGRRAGKFQELRELSATDDLMQQVEEEGMESLSDDQRDELFDGLATYEASAMLVRVRDALGHAVLAGELDSGGYRQAVERMQTFLEERLDGAYLRGYFAADEAQQEREMARLRADVRRQVQALLPAVALTPILERIEEEERRFRITQDLSDDVFTLDVHMPGTVVWSNALSMEAGQVTWEFTGADFQGGDLVLTAISVLDRATAP